MNIEMRNPSEFCRAPGSASIPESTVQATCTSIRRRGARPPIVVNTYDEVLLGLRRWQAAMQLQLNEVPVIVLDLIPSQQDTLLRAAHDYEFRNDPTVADLPPEVRNLLALEYDLSDLGFVWQALSERLEGVLTEN